MMRLFKRTSRILLLVVLVLFAVQVIDAKPFSGRAGHYTAAQQEPPRPTARRLPPADQRTEAVPLEPAASPQAQADAETQKQLADLQHQLMEQALNRMRNGQASFDFGDLWSDFFPTVAWVAFLIAAFWITRIIVDNRRWNKMVKVQTETHAKLLDRFASSQEMLAYVQSDAGKKFLEMPIFEGQRRQLSSLPFGRILWSVQIGIIAAVFGAGILFLRGRVPPDADLGFQVLGILILTLGIGFIVSGGVSYILAKHFGLLEQRNNLAHSERNA